VPPIVLKSHAPTITHDNNPNVLTLLTSADLRLHSIRNAIDNIVSRFHGNPRALAARKGTEKEGAWEQFLAAREKNETTQQFAK